MALREAGRLSLRTMRTILAAAMAIQRIYLERSRAGITGIAFANMVDEETTHAAHEAGVGSTIDVQLGGKIGPEFGGPIEIQARVRALTDGRFQFEGPMLQPASRHGAYCGA